MPFIGRHPPDANGREGIASGALASPKRVPCGMQPALPGGSRLNEHAAYPYHLRSPARIASFFEGLTLVPPGLVTTSRWRPYVTDATGEPREVDALCGVGRKGLQGPQGLMASRRGQGPW